MPLLNHARFNDFKGLAIAEQGKLRFSGFATKTKKAESLESQRFCGFWGLLPISAGSSKEANQVPASEHFWHCAVQLGSLGLVHLTANY